VRRFVLMASPDETDAYECFHALADAEWSIAPGIGLELGF
jgi:hypothetical protein